jgi:hypothetical protein
VSDFCEKHSTNSTCPGCVAAQLAWDSFAAGAPVPQTGGDTNVGWNRWELASMAAEYADALMVERAKRMKP